MRDFLKIVILFSDFRVVCKCVARMGGPDYLSFYPLTDDKTEQLTNVQFSQ